MRRAFTRSSLAASSVSSSILVAAEDLGGFKAIRAPEMQPDAHVRGMVRFNAKTDVWALGILLTEAALLLPIEEYVTNAACPIILFPCIVCACLVVIPSLSFPRRWYPDDRPKMQSFGRMPELQAAKVAEVGAASPHFARIVSLIFT